MRHRTFSNMLLVAYVTRAATRRMQSTQANGKLSSITASHSRYSELSSIAVDHQAYQLTGTSSCEPTPSCSSSLSVTAN